ncbi:caspase family protein [Bradyrhizobium sp. WYCCWR 13023]|uniref:Caspase family protein n=1 Tax=Bradyrhizobium zhengyangense TaxID=2911009 RepID=A0A9X1RA64_9BRAD|nr:caspase family protein [Bradyrhizobium zhengyangense]MCG2628686.1 caspase family protein [Bradyrhizobium zhengyangense]MCG2644401.1 caspase family protein [Bradyrhizobium zhengyangense]MCG2668477.1 caspase family protein [Bradyrhizobium zhengyangense]
MRRPVLCNLILASGLLALTQLMTPTEAAAEARLALVIGQSAYRTVPELPNAANDAKGMAELLGNAGFTVTSAPNLAQNEMRQAISDFAGKVSASGADTVALVFYAGHGLQIDGENYLVPVDLDPKREADIPLQGVRLNDMLNTLGALPTRARIFMLDACRNNPFPALSGAGHGLAIVDTKAGAPGSFISYSTSPGAEAEDGSGADSPYTTAALAVAKQPNVPIEEVFKRIRIAVAQSTDGRQIPWESSSLTTDFKFFGESSGQPAAPGANAMALASTPRSVADWRKDLQGKDAKVAYDLVIADDTVEAYQAYVELYAQDLRTPRLRTVMERRRQMLAWDRAVAINTRASYEAYLANWDNSDLAATARRLLLRVQNRNYVLPVAAAAVPVAVAMAPTCPCSAPTPPASTPVNPTIAPIIKKRVDDTPPPSKRKVVDTPPKRRPPPDEVVVERAPPQQGPPPAAIMQGIGIGVGIGMGMGGGGRGGEMGHGDYGRGNRY